MSPSAQHTSADEFLRQSHVVLPNIDPAGEPASTTATSTTEPAKPFAVTPATSPEVGSQTVLSLMALALLVGQPISRFYAMFKSRRVASAAIRLLEAAGFLDCPEVAHGKGAKLKLVSLTLSAWELLAEQGVQRPAYLLQGGDLHDYAARAMQEVAHRHGDRIEFEQLVGTVRFDAIWHRKGGAVLHTNIGVSDPQREAEALSRALDQAATADAHLLHVGVSTRFNQGVARRLKVLYPAKHNRVEYRLLGALVKSAYLQKDHAHGPQ